MGRKQLSGACTTLSLFNAPQYNVSGAAFWTWKKSSVGSSYPYYNKIDTTDKWYQTIKWTSNTSLPQPTPSEMQTGINEFIQNIKLNNGFFNNTLSDMIRPSCITSVASATFNNHHNLYPNPASGMLTVQFRHVFNGKVYVTDICGKLLITMFVEDDKIDINIDTLNSGIYFLKTIDKSGKVSVSKFIKE